MTHEKISFLDLEVRRCPHEAHRQLRERSPIYFDESCGMFMVLGYDEARTVLGDPSKFSSETGQLLVKESADQDQINAVFEEHGYLPVSTLVVVDPPTHTFHRSLVNKAFNALTLKRIADFVETTVDRMVSEFVARGGGNFYSEVAAPLPSFIVADQLGISSDDFKKFRKWTDAVVAEANPENSLAEQLAITRTICDLQKYIAEKAEEYVQNPRQNLLSDLVHADVDGRKLNLQELVSIFVILIAGSHDTTTSALCSAVYRLCKDKQMQDELRADLALVPKFVEELMRFDSPVAGLFRRATCATHIAGTEIPEEALLMVRYGAANRDPKMFEQPDVLDFRRPNAARHVAFGYGPHTCVGNLLARTEMRIVISKLLEFTSNLRLSRGEDGVSWLANFIVYGPDSLEIATDVA